MTFRVAVIASHVIQYQAPFFRMLAANAQIDATVFYCDTAGAVPYVDSEMGATFKWDLDLLGGYSHHFLKNIGLGRGYSRLINPGILHRLALGKWDAVILFLGWGTITSLLAIAACRMSATPLLLYGDSSFPPPETTVRGSLRAAFMRTIVRMTDAFLVSGVLNAQYYLHYGANRRRFFDVPWAIDNERFAAAARFSPGERDCVRSGAAVGPTDVAIVYSGKLIPRKDPMIVLRAIERMQAKEKAVAVFLGDGELRREMERFALHQGIRAHFAGFVNQSALPKRYAAGDVFVLPSWDDPRATVVNEAMACGLPIVITDRCGPAADIARHGDNAYVFHPGDVDTLAAHLDALASDPERRSAMGRRSTEIISDWSYERGVAGVLKALESLR